MLADPYKLVDGAHTTEDGPIFNDDMARYLGIIADYTIVADDTVVRDMAISQDHAIAAYRGFFRGPWCPGLSYKFPDRRIVPYLNGRLFSVKFKILRISGNYSAREYPAILSDPGSFHDRHIAANPGPFSHFHILMNHRERIHFYIGRKPGIRVNRGKGMDHSLSID